VKRSLEAIVQNYATGKPVLCDYGVPTNDVLKRISNADFEAFYEQAKPAADLAKRAFDATDRTESGNLWRELLGTKFPEPPDSGGGKKQGFTPPDDAASPGSGRFA
jgi:hypothetical protein